MLKNSKLARCARGSFFLAVAALSLSSIIAPQLRAQVHAIVPAAKFKIEKRDAALGANALVQIRGTNNRLSTRPPASGDYSYINAVYVEPEATIRKDNGSLINLAFNVRAQTLTDPRTGRQHTLGTLKEIKFLIEHGDLVILPISDPDSSLALEAEYNPDTESWWSLISERGSVKLTREQFHELAAARAFSVKLVGSEFSIVIRQRDVSKSFLDNLKKFEAALSEEERARRAGGTPG